MSEQNPPADDVSEALYEILRFGNYGDEMDTVDRILKRFEVRRRGTVTEPINEALLAVRDEIVRNEGRADAACLATLEAIAAGVWPRGTVTDAEEVERCIRFALRFDLGWKPEDASLLAKKLAPHVLRRLQSAREVRS